MIQVYIIKPDLTTRTTDVLLLGNRALQASHLGTLMKMDMGAIKGVRNTLT